MKHTLSRFAPSTSLVLLRTPGVGSLPRGGAVIAWVYSLGLLQFHAMRLARRAVDH